jgi:hypothetical protein
MRTLRERDAVGQFGSEAFREEFALFGRPFDAYGHHFGATPSETVSVATRRGEGVYFVCTSKSAEYVLIPDALGETFTGNMPDDCVRVARYVSTGKIEGRGNR